MDYTDKKMTMKEKGRRRAQTQAQAQIYFLISLVNNL